MRFILPKQQAQIIESVSQMSSEEKRLLSEQISETSIMDFKGSWNPETNYPLITSPKLGDTWFIQNSGSTPLGTQNVWASGDLALFDGQDWKKFKNPDIAEQLAKNSFQKSGGIISGDINLTNQAQVNFDVLSQEPEFKPGRLYYSPTEHTLILQTNISGVALSINQENTIPATNKTGQTIPNGQVVYINGAHGSRPTIQLARADAEITSEGVIGLATHDILDNATGLITTNGLVHQLDTSQLIVGSPVYLSTSVAGGFTSTKPVSPNRSVVIGYCQEVHNNQGVILVRVHVPQKFIDCPDLDLPIDGGSPTYNVYTKRWESRIIQQGVSAGQSTKLYLDASATVADNLALSTTPSAYNQQTSTQLTQFTSAAPAFVKRFVSSTLNTTTIPAGTWTFNTYCSSTATNSTTTIYTRINRRVIQNGMTCSITGSGTTRTLTVLGGAPFVANDVRDGTILTATLIETPIQSAWISGFTSQSVVTITLTNAEIANFTNQPLNALYYYLFSGEQTPITSSTPQLKTYTATLSGLNGFPMTINASDRLVATYFGRASSGTSRTVSIYHGGSAAYQDMTTTFVASTPATETNAGTVELATGSETTDMLDGTRAVTPLGLSSIPSLDNNLIMSHQGITMSSAGTGRSANSDIGGCVILLPSVTLNQWVEARSYFGAGPSAWQAQLYPRNNRPWVFRTYVQIPLTQAQTSCVILFGNPTAVATTPASLNGGTQQGFGIRIDYASGQYILSALYRRNTDGGQNVAAQTLTVTHNDNHRLAIKVVHNGSGTLSYYAHNAGAWVLITSVSGFGTGNTTAERWESIVAIQACNTGGSATDSQWVWYKNSSFTNLISV